MVALDTKTESKTYYVGIALIAYYSLTIGVGFGVSLPSMHAYATTSKSEEPPGLNQSDSFFSILVAMISVGELIGALSIGTIASNHKLGHLFFAANIFGIIGNTLYAMGEYPSIVMLGRLIMGLWSGSVNTLIRVWIQAFVPSDRLTGVMSTTGLFNCISMAASPALVGLFAKLDVHSGPMRLDPYRTPGWFCVLLCLSCLFTIWFLPEPVKTVKAEAKINSNPNTDSARQSGLNMDSTIYGSNKNNNVEESSSLLGRKRQWYKKLWNNNGVPNHILYAVIIGFFTSSLGFTILETMATPIMSDQLGMGVEKSWMIFVIGGSCNVLTFGLQAVLSSKKLINSRHLTIFCMIFSALGCLVLVDWNNMNHDPCHDFKSMDTCLGDTLNSTIQNTIQNTFQSTQSHTECIWNQKGLYGDCEKCEPVCHNPNKIINIYQLFIGFAMINMAFPPGRIGTGSLYSEFLGKKKSGFMQAILVCSGNVARILAPIVAVALYTAVKERTFLLMIFLFVWFSLCSVLFITLYTKMTSVFENAKKNQTVQ